MVMNARLQKLLKEVGFEEQIGFSSGRRCSGGGFCIPTALKKRREPGLESWVPFVDLAKAFDSMPRDVLWAVPTEMGVSSHLIFVIQRINIGALPRRCRPQVTRIDMHGALHSRSAIPWRLTRGLITVVSRTELTARGSSVP